MPFITKYLLITLVVSPMVILAGCRFRKRLPIILYAFLNLLSASWLIIDEISRYGRSENTPDGAIRLFLVNDVSMLFYYIYIPLIVIGSIIPAAFFLGLSAKRRREKTLLNYRARNNS